MKLYVIRCFDNFDYQADAEMVYTFTNKKKALKCIKENWTDFQDCAYPYCQLKVVYTDSYLGGLTLPDEDKTLYFKFVSQSGEYFDSHWEQMTDDDVRKCKTRDDGYARAIFMVTYSIKDKWDKIRKGEKE